MSDENYLKEVREHYENFPYPPVDPDQEYDRLYMPMLESFDRMNFHAFEGKRDFTRGFRCLIAGGGTGDAVIGLAEQLRDHAATTEVVYVDMSEASMAVAKKRAEVRGLTNIRWIRDSLLNLEKHGLGEFDYINSSGVLHHLADPDEGLRVLVSLLKDDGAMGIMLYATYGRMAVYQMQELLRIVNKDEPNLQKRVDNAKLILQNLPSSHWFVHSQPVFHNEVQNDNGIFDLLLHSQDRAYTIPELYDYLGTQKLQLLQLFPDQRNVANRLYDPGFYIHDPALLAKAKGLPLPEQQALAELLNGQIYKHTFYAARTPRVPPALTDDLTLIPHFSSDSVHSVEAVLKAIRASDQAVFIEQPDTGTHLIFAKSPHHEAMVRAMDGERSLRDIFRSIIDGYAGRKGAPNYPQLLAEFKPMYDAFNMYGFMYLRYPGSSRPIGHYALQDRVPQRPSSAA